MEDDGRSKIPDDRFDLAAVAYVQPSPLPRPVIRALAPRCPNDLGSKLAEMAARCLPTKPDAPVTRAR